MQNFSENEIKGKLIEATKEFMSTNKNKDNMIIPLNLNEFIELQIEY